MGTDDFGRIDDFGWTAARPRGHRRLRVAGLTAFWLAVLVASVTVGWILAEGLATMWIEAPAQ